MAKGTKADQFVNRAFIDVVQSAANTITFQELHSGVAMFEKVGWVLNRLEYDIPMAAVALMTASGDTITLGVSRSDQIAVMSRDDARVLDARVFGVVYHGTPANAMFTERPTMVSDFADLPGGGLLIPGAPIFLGCDSTGLATPATVSVTIYYTMIKLVPAQYWELVEAMQIVS